MHFVSVCVSVYSLMYTYTPYGCVTYGTQVPVTDKNNAVVGKPMHVI